MADPSSKSGWFHVIGVGTFAIFLGACGTVFAAWAGAIPKEAGSGGMFGMGIGGFLNWVLWLLKIFFIFLCFECHKFAWITWAVATGTEVEISRKRVAAYSLGGIEAILCLLSIYLLVF